MSATIAGSEEGDQRKNRGTMSDCAAARAFLDLLKTVPMISTVYLYSKLESIRSSFHGESIKKSLTAKLS